MPTRTTMQAHYKNRAVARAAFATAIRHLTAGANEFGARDERTLLHALAGWFHLEETDAQAFALINALPIKRKNDGEPSEQEQRHAHARAQSTTA